MNKKNRTDEKANQDIEVKAKQEAEAKQDADEKAKQEADEKAKEAKDRLTAIEVIKPDIPDHMNNLAISKNAVKYFKCYKKMDDDIEASFEECLYKIKPVSLSKGTLRSETKKGASHGKYGHSILSKYIRGETISEEEKAACEAINEILKAQYPGFRLLKSEFPLWGFTKANQSVFWRGKANAIAWCDNQYVIVDWTFVPILEFWEKGETYGQHLHQCLVYARLLQLHLELDKLPYILIVPINSETAGKDIHPGLFKDYPQECKDKLEEYIWSKTAPTEEQNRSEDWNHLIKEPHRGKEIPADTKLTDLFSEDATFQDFSKVFNLPPIKVESTMVLETTEVSTSQPGTSKKK